MMYVVFLVIDASMRFSMNEFYRIVSSEYRYLLEQLKNMHQRKRQMTMVYTDQFFSCFAAEATAAV
jgi:hypothetical protein